MNIQTTPVTEYCLSQEVVLSLVTARTFPEEQALDSWPITPPIDIPSTIVTLCREIKDILFSSRGAVIVKMDSESLVDGQLCIAAWNLFTAICEPMQQYITGELIYPVEISAAAPNASFYSSSNQAGEFHTDGTLLAEVPEVAALMGLAVADRGGETVLIDGLELCRQLERDNPEHVAILAGNHHFDINGQIEGISTKLQPIMTKNNGQLEIRYLRRYIEQGYNKAGKPMPEGLRPALDELDQLAAKEANQSAVLLSRGVILIWNNHRFIHGRRSFTGTGRRLRRIYGRQRNYFRRESHLESEPR